MVWVGGRRRGDEGFDRMHLMVDCLDAVGSAGALPLVGGLGVLVALLVHGAARRRDQSRADYAVVSTSEDVC